MTLHLELFCDFCNGSNQRREPGMEISHGYAKVLLDIGEPADECLPIGWEVVGDNEHDFYAAPKLACDHCLAEAILTQATLRTATLRIDGSSTVDEKPSDPATGDAGSPWPSRSSPFGPGKPGGLARG